VQFVGDVRAADMNAGHMCATGTKLAECVCIGTRNVWSESCGSNCDTFEFSTFSRKFWGFSVFLYE
jgi:hypothetical protein